MSVRIIVPHRGLAAAKTRLAPVLDDESREALARRLMVQVLGVAHEACGDVVVISPSEALEPLAAAAGARLVVQRGLGLNDGLEQARQEAIADGVTTLVILHGDLPNLQTDDVAALLDALPEDGGVAIAPDRAGAGTNALGASAARRDRLPIRDRLLRRACGRSASGWHAARRGPSAWAGVRSRHARGPGPLARAGRRGLISLIPLVGIPEVAPGDDLAALIEGALAAAGIGLEDEDVLVVTQKVVSKAEGRVVELASVTARQEAVEWGAQWGKDPRQVELVLQESAEVLRMAPGGLIISRTRHGFVCANAGVDLSNVGGGDVATLLPVDPDASARRSASGWARSPAHAPRSSSATRLGAHGATGSWTSQSGAPGSSR